MEEHDEAEVVEVIQSQVERLQNNGVSVEGLRFFQPFPWLTILKGM